MREAAAARPASEGRWTLIDDVDLTLRRLLEDKLPRPRTPFVVRFDQPAENWSPAAGLNLNVYLYDVRENLELRDPAPRLQRLDDGTFLRRKPPARVDLFYVVTAWSAVVQHNEAQVLEEHRLLSDVLRLLLRYPTLPRDVLQGSLVGQQPPLPTLVAQLGDGLPHPPAEFWSSLQSPLRPSLNLIVTVSLEPASTDPPPRLLPVASEDTRVGPVGGAVCRLSLRPALRERVEAGAEVLGAVPEPAVAGRTDAEIRAADDVVDVVDAGAIRANSWLRIVDGGESDYFRVPAPTEPGQATLPVEPALRFAHAGGAQIERLSIEVAQTSLASPAAAGADSIEVGERDGLAADDVLMLDDGARTEFVQLAAFAAATGAGPVPVAQPLRFDHDAGRPVRAASVSGSATTLAAAANQPAPELAFAAPAPALPPDTVVMVDRGDAVEFARLGAAGSPRPLQDPLRGNHPAGAEVRTVEDAQPLGVLVQPAAAGAGVVVAAGDAVARLRVRDLVRVGDGYHELTGIAVEPGAFAGEPARFLRIGGRVVEADDPQLPVVGARVVLAGTGIGAVTDGDGRFVLADAPAGPQTLEVTAAGFADGAKAVQVPSTTFNEYEVRLDPA